MSGSNSTSDWTGLFDGDCAIQAPLDAEELRRIPAKRGVFLLEGPHAQPILLATAANIRSRMRFRLAPAEGKTSKRVDLRQVAVRLRWKLADSHFETDWRFLQLARAVYPDTYADLWRPRSGWFVHVNLSEAYPWLRPTREVFAQAGRTLGPFPERRAAQRFIELLREIFDLCRCERILRQAPKATPCVYAEIGRCRAPCAGRISMDEYRSIVAEACRCAAGQRGPLRAHLLAEMKRCAAARQYEQAAAAKARLERLGELERSEYRYVAPTERFRYVLVQRGTGRSKAKSFFVDRGAIRAGPTLDYPLRPEQLEGLLSAMREMVSEPRRLGVAERENIALVAHYLFAPEGRRGVSLRYEPAISAGRLAEEIDSHAAELKLTPSGRRPAAGGPD